MPPTSWTPALSAGTTNPTLGSSGMAVGHYTLQGKMCTVTGYIGFGGTGMTGGNGNYSINLPLPVSPLYPIVSGNGFINKPGAADPSGGHGSITLAAASGPTPSCSIRLFDGTRLASGFALAVAGSYIEFCVTYMTA